MGTGEMLGQPDRMLGNNLGWTSIPSRRNRNRGKELGAMSQFGLKGFSPSPEAARREKKSPTYIYQPNPFTFSSAPAKNGSKPG